MKKKVIIILAHVTLLTLLLASFSWGLTITEPKPGAVFRPGDKVTIKIQTATGENIHEIFFTAAKMNKYVIDSQPPFEFQFVIDSNFTGTEEIVAAAKLTDGTNVDAEVQIVVVLPSNIISKSISVYPTFVVLSKLPPSSDPNRVRIAETENLKVSGMYSDGIKREITSSTTGTTYTSSDEKIAKVSSEGEITAQAVGTVNITVKNGDLKAVVKVIVKSKNK